VRQAHVIARSNPEELATIVLRWCELVAGLET
jgi:hypothetical protein